MAVIDVVLIRGGRGGFEIILNRACTYLKKNGHSVRYVQLMPAEVAWAAGGLSHVALYDKDTSSFTYDDARAKYAALLARDEKKPALILAAGWPMMVYVAKGAAQDAGVPVPVCAWLHGDIRFYEESDSGGMDILQYADMCIGISHTIASDIHRAYPDKVVYRVNNAVDEAKIVYREERNTRRLAYVGRLSEEKAVPVILHALAKTKIPWEMDIVGQGTGNEERELRALCDRLRLKRRVHFRGWSDSPWEMLTDTRAVIVASLYEGGPLSAIEALACGMQVVSTPCGCLPEVLREGETGYFTPFADVDALTLALDKLGQKPFTPETARRCRDAVIEFLPDFALYDFLKKVEACAGLIALEQRYTEQTTDYYVRKESAD